MKKYFVLAILLVAFATKVFSAVDTTPNFSYFALKTNTLVWGDRPLWEGNMLALVTDVNSPTNGTTGLGVTNIFDLKIVYPSNCLWLFSSNSSNYQVAYVSTKITEASNEFTAGVLVGVTNDLLAWISNNFATLTNLLQATNAANSFTVKRILESNYVTLKVVSNFFYTTGQVAALATAAYDDAVYYVENLYVPPYITNWNVGSFLWLNVTNNLTVDSDIEVKGFIYGDGSQLTNINVASSITEASNLLTRAIDPFSIMLINDVRVHPTYYDSNAFMVSGWVYSNLVSENIKAVIATGDLTDSDGEQVVSYTAWSNRWEQVASQIPLLQTMGEMDYVTTNARTYTNFYRSFPPIWMMRRAWYNGGYYNITNVSDHWMRITNASFPILVISLEVNPTLVLLNWASNICTLYPNDYVILNTHSWGINNNWTDRLVGRHDPDWNLTSTTNMSPEESWEASIKYWKNLGMVVSGHQFLSPNLEEGPVAGNGIQTKAGNRFTLNGFYGNTVQNLCYNFSMVDEPYLGYTQIKFFPQQNRITTKINCGYPNVVYGPYAFAKDALNQYNFSMPIRTDFGAGLSVNDRITISGGKVASNYNSYTFPTLSFTSTNKAYSFLNNVTNGTMEIRVGTNQNSIESNSVVTKISTDGILDKSNVKYWGAKGDTNTDDTIAINAAFASVLDYYNISNARGNTIYFPAGTYHVTNVLRIKPGTVVKGAGKSATVIQNWGTTNDVFYFLAVPGIEQNQVTIENIGVYQSAAATDGAAFHIAGNRANAYAMSHLQDLNAVKSFYGYHWDNNCVGQANNCTSWRSVSNAFWAEDIMTAFTFNNCFTSQSGGYGYKLNLHYSSMVGCACDKSAMGGYWITYGSQAFSMLMCGAEDNNGVTLFLDNVEGAYINMQVPVGNALSTDAIRADAGQSITLAGCIIQANAAASGWALCVTNNNGYYPQDITSVGSLLSSTWGLGNINWRNKVTTMGDTSTTNHFAGTTKMESKVQVLGDSAAYPTIGSPAGSFNILNTTEAYGILAGVHGSGNTFFQAQRVDGTATPYNIILQPSGGKVGIGTNLPLSMLHLNGPLLADGGITNPGSYYGHIVNITNLFVRTNVLAVTSTNVGIGITNPTYILEMQRSVDAPVYARVDNPNVNGSAIAGYYVTVAGSGGAVFQVFPTNYSDRAFSGTARIRTDSTMTNGLILDTGTVDSPIRLRTWGTTRIFIDNNNSGGRVGVGTVRPYHRLTVADVDSTIPGLGTNGGQFAILGSAEDYGLQVGVLGTGNVFLQAQRVDGTPTGYDLLLNPSGGKVGILTNAPKAELHVVGSVLIEGGQTNTGPIRASKFYGDSLSYLLSVKTYTDTSYFTNDVLIGSTVIYCSNTFTWTNFVNLEAGEGTYERLFSVIVVGVSNTPSFITYPDFGVGSYGIRLWTNVNNTLPASIEAASRYRFAGSALGTNITLTCVKFQ